MVENGRYSETTQGTPQGGIISPVLCNVALNGLEQEIRDANPLKKGISAGVHVIRYADDLIITGKNKGICERNKSILQEFLLKRGLELSEKKTKITHIKDGFDFLGFNIRRMKYDPRKNNPTEQDTVLVIKPSKKGTKKLMTRVNEIINKNEPMRALIRDLNPVLRG